MIGVPHMHRLPANVKGHLKDSCEQHAAEVSFYSQAMVALRALSAVGETPGDEPLSCQLKQPRPLRLRDKGIP